jgi:hypothetical protein
VIDWDEATIIGREGDRMTHWIREVINIRKHRDKTMNRDAGAYQLSHVMTKCSPWRHLVESERQQQFDKTASAVKT